MWNVFKITSQSRASSYALQSPVMNLQITSCWISICAPLIWIYKRTLKKKGSRWGFFYVFKMVHLYSFAQGSKCNRIQMLLNTTIYLFYCQWNKCHLAVVNHIFILKKILQNIKIFYTFRMQTWFKLSTERIKEYFRMALFFFFWLVWFIKQTTNLGNVLNLICMPGTFFNLEGKKALLFLAHFSSLLPNYFCYL